MIILVLVVILTFMDIFIDENKVETHRKIKKFRNILLAILGCFVLLLFGGSAISQYKMDHMHSNNNRKFSVDTSFFSSMGLIPLIVCLIIVLLLILILYYYKTDPSFKEKLKKAIPYIIVSMIGILVIILVFLVTASVLDGGSFMLIM